MTHNSPPSALVTGANRGLGLELVRQLLTLPQPPKLVFATCRNPNGPQAQSLQELAEKEPNLRILRLDVTDPTSIQLAETQVRNYLSGEGLALLVNNAGILIPSSLHEEKASSMHLSYQTNVVGPLLLGQVFGSLLKKAASIHSKKELSWARAAIINMGSAAGSLTELLGWEYGQATSYRCSKVNRAALNMLTRCQGLTYAKEGILCAGIHPGWVKTDMSSISEYTPMLTVTESIQGVLKVMAQLTEKEAGAFLDWEGHVVPW
ncbi:PREDICTED: uncharacterized oxidoreductase C663.09c-like [Chrysochloris asiatica]|uniref:Uncharacterized oxidoreductase C663.09c-like n=1 Tax=Chrysochloris asiatica TaxID=185453 RepID=A0A9B0T9G5_CHRAS|nr:PREDICTED: uncharacterized oxidoreductase C663.09c-like [Chrysochloris asiatica]